MKYDKLVDMVTNEKPYSIEEIKYAKNLADGLLRVYGKKHSLEALIHANRLHSETARQDSANIPNSSIHQD